RSRWKDFRRFSAGRVLPAQSRSVGRGTEKAYKCCQSPVVGHDPLHLSAAPTEDKHTDSTVIAEPVPSCDGCASRAGLTRRPHAQYPRSTRRRTDEENL